MKRGVSVLAFVLLFFSCKSNSKKEYSKVIDDPNTLHAAYEKLTDVIIHDIFSPPVASRIYGYATIAGYEALIQGKMDYKSLDGQIKKMPSFPKPESDKEYSFSLASFKAVMTVARALTFTVDQYDEFEKEYQERFKKSGIPTDVYDRSVAYGEAIASHVLEYAKKDNYAQTRGLRYTVKQDGDKWKPTPPQYADAMEPYWSTVQPLVIDSATQFPSAPVINFSKDKSSPYWKELMEVYDISKTLTEDQKKIAWFWDDNAFVMNVQGHVMFANKKMTPPGHWMAIVRAAASQGKKDIYESADGYLRVAFACHEAFICSWYEKYATEKIRPETVINADIDAQWTPFLQTPPFPEYPSGHSFISAASAEALSLVFGENVSITDSTEYKYDHGIRKFKSFREAALECSISRVYGGIHYRSGCEQGNISGVKIGKYLNSKIQTKIR